ncbi:hypothetical protein QJS04_geneDACA013727 [Acorus gramineus]|uniref:Uncharacterized protein n=1 Tax=Acorus gramineus TaxID=55184 RepID=A0AAV9AXL0_ACOGR|nr:hypothetical protein QJS04_geneDACA013727 [Acorus gramineus]
MLDPIPSCFRGGAADPRPPSSSSTAANTTTSVYQTRLGLAALTWSRTVVGLALRVDLRFDGDGDGEGLCFRFQLRPWLFWKRRGSKKFDLEQNNRWEVEFAWDLTRARFASGGPDPDSGYFVAVSISGEMLLVAGDLIEEAYRKTKARNPDQKQPLPAVMILRREHVVASRSYTTRAEIGGKIRKISIDLTTSTSGGDPRLCFAVDGKRVLQVKRLRWKFRGNEKIEVDGVRIQVSWDVHGWLFDGSATASASAEEAQATPAAAVFAFRFVKATGGRGGGELGGYFGENNGGITRWSPYGGYFGNKSSSSSSSNYNNNNWSLKSKREKRRRSSYLLKTGSSSSASSSASSGSGSSVMEWASQEENELLSSGEFSLLVFASRC